MSFAAYLSAIHHLLAAALFMPQVAPGQEWIVAARVVGLVVAQALGWGILALVGWDAYGRK